MKRNSKKHKLTLNTETITTLTDRQLTAVAGGNGSIFLPCVTQQCSSMKGPCLQ